MTWILLTALLVLFVRNHADPQGVAKDIHRIAKSVRRTARELARTVRKAVKDAKRETAEIRKTVPEPAVTTAEAHKTRPVQPETQKNNELLKELEQKAGTAAMLANVPTIAFPEGDPKYDSSRKYLYA